MRPLLPDIPRYDSASPPLCDYRSSREIHRGSSMSANFQIQGTLASSQSESGRTDPDRIRRLTFKQDLERIDKRTRDTILQCAKQDPAGIARRLAELDSEWPVERALMAGAGSFVWLGLGLGAMAN